MNDFFQNPDDGMQVEPADLGSEFTEALASSLAKELASEYGTPWTEKLELELQEKISVFVAAAKARNLKTIRVVVTQKNGQKRSHELDIERINKTRSLH